MLTIYNTLTRKKEEFKPLEPGKISMYVCGPTVYDVPHIGHARSVYSFDVIRKYLEYSGFDVTFIRNVTDVDDKIIKKAVSELRENNEQLTADILKNKSSEVAKRYLKIYHNAMDVLDIQPPDAEPKATENISEMIEFIELLIQKGYAYAVGGNVYFSVEKFSGYGKLSNRDKEQMLHGVRIEVDKNKRYPLDFALWKEVKPEEPSWESPWGAGRPGWHIECSVMSTLILGDQFDIHGGGLDLIFPHHENEIAQAEAATGKSFANYWIHNGLLTVGGEKMAKSLGNYITIEDFFAKYKDPNLLKLAFLSSHYRSPMDCGDNKMEEAKRSKERIMIFIDKVKKNSEKPVVDKEVLDSVERIKDKFRTSMEDDFNTPVAISAIFDAVHEGNICLSKDDIISAAAFKECILEIADILGLSLIAADLEIEETEKIEQLVAQRQGARKNNNYAESDKLRDELLAMGIVVEDTPEGSVWRKK